MRYRTIAASVRTADDGAAAARTAFDVDRVRADFPILTRPINGHRMVYLDSANTSQMPMQVLDAMREHQSRHNGNAARSVHTLGTEATTAYEGARAKVARFIGARSPDEVVFAKNSTEAINLVAHSFHGGLPGRHGDRRLSLGPGDEIVVSQMEHHSNLVPWQMLCERTGATLRWFPLTDEGRLDLSGIDELITARTKLVSLVHMSNILGTVNPTAAIVGRAHDNDALVMLDASQSAPHMPIDVAVLGVDLLAFSGHKMCGPTGIGVLWGRAELLEAMPPFLGGGAMIDAVSMTGATYAHPPARFEAGTPPIVPAVGLGAAVDYLTGVGMAEVHRHDQHLTAYALRSLQRIPGLRIFGPTAPVDRGPAVSFAVEGVDTVGLGRILDARGIQIRVGRHCAAPVCARYGVPAMARASFYLYTTDAEIDALAETLAEARRTAG
ncbi:cysteine desulfurase [Winogradskya consettensis]|uniref:Cysteine desulfurase n=1 Tax=Winogradskya consettensis TaxID=113560 RepID=A0A919T0B2_9ACTN|nr:cysteine desulfurase [Actinoplanes consettensis]GIM82499.1 putative cysteine desulfurase [Actinoplanes consettensis]